MRILTSLAAAALACCAPAAIAQSYPSKPIRLIVPNPPGGGSDFVARTIGQRLALGQPVVIENRAGGGTNIGSDLVAKAAPDGYTLLLATSANAINVSLYSKMTYDTVRDFEAVTLVAASPVILAVHPSLPVKSVKELIALAKSRQGQLDYASSGNGAANHLSMELFKGMTGSRIVHIPYKGGNEPVIALLAGQVQVMFVAMAQMPYIESGRLRALAVSTAKRSPALPAIPTVAEAGVPGFEVSSWQGVLAPARTPAEVVSRLQREIVAVLQMPKVGELLRGVGYQQVGSTPAEFAEYLRTDVARWAKVVKATGVQVD